MLTQVWLDRRGICFTTSLDTPATSAPLRWDLPPVAPTNNNSISVGGRSSEEVGMQEENPNSASPETDLQFLVDALERGTEASDTFYSEAGGIDMLDTVVFPKVRVCPK